MGKDLLTAGSRIGNRSAAEVIAQDMKTYEEDGHIFTVSQIEVSSTAEILQRKEEFFCRADYYPPKRKSTFFSTDGDRYYKADEYFVDFS